MKVIVKLNDDEKLSAEMLFKTFNNEKQFDIDKEYVFKYYNLKDNIEGDITLDQLLSIFNAMANDELELVLDN